jgi:hypothetical protein
MLSDLAPASSILVGVDVSPQRMSLCKNIIKKYHINRNTSASTPISAIPDDTKTITVEKDNAIPSPRVTIRLYCADGTTFGTGSSTNSKVTNHNLVFDYNAAVEDFHGSAGKRKRMNKSARAREKRRLLELQRSEDINAQITDAAAGLRTSEIPVEKSDVIVNGCEKKSDEENEGIGPESRFDRVIVDAECSTDGAMRHNEKRQSTLSSKRRPIWNDTNMDVLIGLQKRLIDSGFRRLKIGGVMVYSTCSLSFMQNEQVVLSLLEKHQDAFIIPVSFSMRNTPSQDLPFIEGGSIPGTVRFNPIVNDDVDCLIQGSGFFLAKIGKRSQHKNKSLLNL